MLDSHEGLLADFTSPHLTSRRVASRYPQGDCPGKGLAIDTDKPRPEAGVPAMLEAGVPAMLDAGDVRVADIGSPLPICPLATSHARVGSERRSKLAAALSAACRSVGRLWVAARQAALDAMSIP
jgi:hypothetical protein